MPKGKNRRGVFKKRPASQAITNPLLLTDTVGSSVPEESGNHRSKDPQFSRTNSHVSERSAGQLKGVSFVDSVVNSRQDSIAQSDVGTNRTQTTVVDGLNQRLGYFDSPAVDHEILRTNFEEKLENLWAKQDKTNLRELAIFFLSVVASGSSVGLYIQPNLQAGAILKSDLGLSLPREVFQYPLTIGATTINAFLNLYLINDIINTNIDSFRAYLRKSDKKAGVDKIKEIARGAVKNILMAIPISSSTIPLILLNSRATGNYAFLASPAFTAVVGFEYYLMHDLSIRDMTREMGCFLKHYVSRPVRNYLSPNQERQLFDTYKDNFELLQSTAKGTLDLILFRLRKTWELQQVKKLGSYVEANNILNELEKNETISGQELLNILFKLNALNDPMFNPQKTEKNVAFYSMFSMGILLSLISYQAYNSMVYEQREAICKSIIGGFLELCDQNWFLAMVVTPLLLTAINWLISVYGNLLNCEFFWDVLTQKNKEMALGTLVCPYSVNALSAVLSIASLLSGGTTYTLSDIYVKPYEYKIVSIIVGWIFTATFNAFPLPLVASKVVLSIYIKALEFLEHCNLLQLSGITTNELNLLRFRKQLENYIEDMSSYIKGEDTTILAFTLKQLDEDFVLSLMGGKKPSELIDEIKELLDNETAEKYSDTWIGNDVEVGNTSVFQHYMTELPQNFHAEVNIFSERRTLSRDLKENSSNNSFFERFSSSARLSEANLTAERPSEFSTTSDAGVKKKSCWDGFCGWGKKTESTNVRVPLRATQVNGV